MGANALIYLLAFIGGVSVTTVLNPVFWDGILTIRRARQVQRRRGEKPMGYLWG